MIDKCIRDVFTPDRLKKLYDDLEVAKREGRLDLDRYCFPFIPWVGRDYYEAPKRILYVGKATDGWDDDVSIPYKTLLSEAVTERVSLYMLCRITENYVEKYLVQGKETHRPFWQLVYRLTPYILDINDNYRLGRRPEYNRENLKRCFYSIAWTNLFKIGVTRGNPNRQMENFLLQEFNTLPSEIECLEPDVVVLLTGESYDHHLNNVFLKSNKREISEGIAKEEIARLESDDDKAIIVRTPHPREWRKLGWRNLESLYDYLRKEIV